MCIRDRPVFDITQQFCGFAKLHFQAFRALADEHIAIPRVTIGAGVVRQWQRGLAGGIECGDVFLQIRIGIALRFFKRKVIALSLIHL